MVNLDTHIVVAVLVGELSARERTVLEGEPDWAIASIVQWELAMLVKRKRLELDLDAREFQDVLRALHVFPISLELARLACSLDFNADPADHLIVATSIVHDMPLMTRDAKIRKSKAVRLA